MFNLIYLTFNFHFIRFINWSKILRPREEPSLESQVQLKVDQQLLLLLRIQMGTFLNLFNGVQLQNHYAKSCFAWVILIVLSNFMRRWIILFNFVYGLFICNLTFSLTNLLDVDPCMFLECFASGYMWKPVPQVFRYINSNYWCPSPVLYYFFIVLTHHVSW